MVDSQQITDVWCAQHQKRDPVSFGWRGFLLSIATGAPCLQSLLSPTIAYARFHLKAHPREHRLHGIEHLRFHQRLDLLGSITRTLHNP